MYTVQYHSTEDVVYADVDKEYFDEALRVHVCSTTD